MGYASPERGGRALDLSHSDTSPLLVSGVIASFVVGLLDRRRRAVQRMGYDSIGALLLFAGGVALLARLGG